MKYIEPAAYIDFCKAGKELREAMPTLNGDELQNGWKCLSLLYLQLDVEEVYRMLAAQRLKFIGREVILREVDLETGESL